VETTTRVFLMMVSAQWAMTAARSGACRTVALPRDSRALPNVFRRALARARPAAIAAPVHSATVETVSHQAGVAPSLAARARTRVTAA